MTDLGIEQIKKSIKDAPIGLPSGVMNAEELQWWLNGYSACIQKVELILDDMCGGQLK